MAIENKKLTIRTKGIGRKKKCWRNDRKNREREGKRERERERERERLKRIYGDLVANFYSSMRAWSSLVEGDGQLKRPNGQWSNK